ncbi:YHS domain-containing (seleno)protein [Arenibacter sp. GZD96]|uniref:YHS domain-containing (seleno)protein n=1 Tax=Aurantibrevibacter litoralis TaxID=3106030 RepID=UPI002AFE0A6A|nr:YHS domain-containing (seleno)protein [Arenibacter sp. GZD-96]MEA1787156.1 YHS domain-containing (seleno)protein [Arenibacter sp. GZD-96]
MKTVSVIACFLIFSLSYAQKTDIYVKGGYAVSGYDVVAYFSHEVRKGDKNFNVPYDGAVFLFATEANAALFKANPKKYAPQYGGHCSYAMAIKGEKVSSNPEVYEIRDGKLHLFHRAEGLTNWKKEGPEKLRPKADANWAKLVKTP